MDGSACSAAVFLKTPKPHEWGGWHRHPIAFVEASGPPTAPSLLQQLGWGSTTEAPLSNLVVERWATSLPVVEFHDAIDTVKQKVRSSGLTASAEAETIAAIDGAVSRLGYEAWSSGGSDGVGWFHHLAQAKIADVVRARHMSIAATSQEHAYGVMDYSKHCTAVESRPLPALTDPPRCRVQCRTTRSGWSARRPRKRTTPRPW